jgi:predicted molibdopterin-dependent oxidoreductase YjgC
MKPLQETESICLCCAEGCGFHTLHEPGKVTGIEYMPDHPVNAGALCLKGNNVLNPVHHPERIHSPLVKQDDGTFHAITWDEAIALISTRLKSTIAKHKPHALAFMASARCTNEENYLLQKFARVLGTNNITCPALEEDSGFPTAALASQLGYAGFRPCQCPVHHHNRFALFGKSSRCFPIHLRGAGTGSYRHLRRPPAAARTMVL